MGRRPKRQHGQSTGKRRRTGILSGYFSLILFASAWRLSAASGRSLSSKQKIKIKRHGVSCQS